ncbi:ATP-dependent RNA helicase DHX36 [Pyrus ussuriensis x Pyrus communis]|uniref:ATP-dependent RNA helicase DHX36 n=1 Tax=Pyrus ussuriensis x Pyrus communis TaxID=2448454 RepID=A0A5N5GBG0_9ROSA|nr:ATP-dependent RNA helicase DHX36 [Pyrus ussuriensis x Pyrus communis]
MPIEEHCLQVKLLDPECKIEEFLRKTLDPPRAETIRNAVSVLQDNGPLLLNEKLTDLGEKLGATCSSIDEQDAFLCNTDELSRPSFLSGMCF